MATINGEAQIINGEAQIIDGVAIAAGFRREIADDVAKLSSDHNVVPKLAEVIVGCRKDSQTYAQMKRKACAKVGICYDVVVDLPEDISEAALVTEVHRLTADPTVHAILVQLPLPKHINKENILNEISIEKDVDGLHHVNIGELEKGRDPLFPPCMAKACMELLSRSGITVKGKRAVVVGRNDIVGLPVYLLLLKADVTVAIVDSRTPNPESIVCEADIVIAAAGQAMMIKGDWIKPGAAVIDVGNIVSATMIKGDIDVGTNSVDDPTRKLGNKLVGDVDVEEVSKVAGYLTPVPGGVGPMIVAMLLKNTLEAAKRSLVQ